MYKKKKELLSTLPRYGFDLEVCFYFNITIMAGNIRILNSSNTTLKKDNYKFQLETS
jgi:hypothetical protein